MTVVGDFTPRGGITTKVTATYEKPEDRPGMTPDDPVPVPIEEVLDLHPFAPRDIRSVVEEYIHAAHDAGLREVRLIHGRGTGVQRGIVQAALERHALVESF